MMIAAVAIGTGSKAVAQGTPTGIIVIKPRSQSAQSPPLPTDLQQKSESALAGMRINNWISLTGYGFFPPVPWNWCEGRTDVTYWWSPTLGTNSVVIDDSLLPYDDWAAQAQVDRSNLGTVDDGLPDPPRDGGGSGDNSPSPEPYSHSPDEFWLELWRVGMTNQLAYLALHGTVPGQKYQLLMKLDLKDTSDWILGQIIDAATGTNRTDFAPVPLNGNSKMFFLAHHADAIVSISSVQDAIEPRAADGIAGVPGSFLVTATGLTNNLVMPYHTSGAASNGLDYTNLSGTVTIPQDVGSATISVDPIEHNDLDFDESVILTPFQTNNYLIQPAFHTAAIVVHDNFVTNIFLPVASGLVEPTGLDYHAPSQSLIVGLGGLSSAAHTFLRIATNGTVSNWSGASVAVEELKLAVAKDTVAGFTNGDIFFNDTSVGGIGWISSNGVAWTTNWTVLTGEPLKAQGGFYLDRTGLFSNQLIVVTGVAPDEGANIWRVDSHGGSTLLASITDPVHCEGVITLSNDVSRYGPLAGKIITGAETDSSGPTLIYAVDPTNGVTTFDLGISAEHFDIIQPNQDLYLLDEGDGQVIKLSRSLLVNFVCDLLITQGRRYAPPPELFIVHWDGARFVLHGIPIGWYSYGEVLPDEIESVTFAPINIPPLP